MKTSISIKGLRLRAYHGVALSERRIGNDFEVDVTLEYPLEEAMRTDCLDNTLNYAEIVESVKQSMSEPSLLIENAAWRIRENLLCKYPEIAGGKVRVTKLLPPIPNVVLDGASVEILW